MQNTKIYFQWKISFFIIYDKWESNNDTIFKKEEFIEIYKILALIV